MKGLGIILEQQYTTLNDALDDDWIVEKPNDYSSEKYDTIENNYFLNCPDKTIFLIVPRN